MFARAADEQKKQPHNLLFDVVRVDKSEPLKG